MSLNLYTYCENDPINSWDPSGHKKNNSSPYVTQAIFINDKNDLPAFGHVALILKYSDGSGTYYSYMAKAPNDINGYVNYAAGNDSEGYLGRAELDPANMKDFFSKGGGNLKNIGVTEYAIYKSNNYVSQAIREQQIFDRYIVIPVSKAEGKSMVDKAEKIYIDKNDNYNLYGNNCNHVAQQILAAGGKNFTPTSGSAMKVRIQGGVSALHPETLPGSLAWNYLDGTIPNGAYRIGWAKSFFNNNYTGTIN